MSARSTARSATGPRTEGKTKGSGFKSRVSSRKVKEQGRQTTELSEEEGGTQGIDTSTQIYLFLFTASPALALLIYGLLTIFVLNDGYDTQFVAASLAGWLMFALCFGLFARIMSQVITLDENRASEPFPVFSILLMYFFFAIGALAFTGTRAENFRCEKKIIGNT